LVEPYQAFCIQSDVAFSSKSGRSPIKGNLRRSLELVEHIVSFRFFKLGYPVKLVAFPEWFLQGSHYANRKEFYKVCISIPGEETDRLGEAARNNRLYLCGHAFEVDPEWKSRFFSTAFIVGPKGKLILKYRKLSTTNMNLTLATSPHDVLDRYQAEIFPVARTEIGNLACFVSYDRHFPEIPRTFALKGAEVFVVPSVAMEPWMSFPNEWWSIVNRVRAHENLCYLVAPNAAWMLDSSHPRSYSIGRSQIVDFNGNVIAQADSPNETVTGGVIDIARLRERRRMAPWNFLVELRTELFRDTYARAVFPPNQWLDEGPRSYDQIDRAHKRAKSRLDKVMRGTGRE